MKKIWGWRGRYTARLNAFKLSSGVQSLDGAASSFKLQYTKPCFELPYIEQAPASVHKRHLLPIKMHARFPDFAIHVHKPEQKAYLLKCGACRHAGFSQQKQSQM